ncbi:hypothetical protein FRX31_033376, partial [Thalictrum thalictroides]
MDAIMPNNNQTKNKSELERLRKELRVLVLVLAEEENNMLRIDDYLINGSGQNSSLTNRSDLRPKKQT